MMYRSIDVNWLHIQCVLVARIRKTAVSERSSSEQNEEYAGYLQF
jgi:hypothetical protein